MSKKSNKKTGRQDPKLHKKKPSNSKNSVQYVSKNVADAQKEYDFKNKQKPEENSEPNKKDPSTRSSSPASAKQDYRKESEQQKNSFMRDAGGDSFKNDEVFKAAMEQAKEITSAFRDYTKIIVAGGTGEAWYEKIKEYLSGMKTIIVLPGNRNDHLPFIYSNVRGYYMFQYMQQNKKKKG